MSLIIETNDFFFEKSKGKKEQFQRREENLENNFLLNQVDTAGVAMREYVRAHTTGDNPCRHIRIIIKARRYKDTGKAKEEDGGHLPPGDQGSLKGSGMVNK